MDKEQARKLAMEEWEADTIHRTGSIQHDHYSKGIRNGKQRHHNRMEARIQVHGIVYKHRAKTRYDCEEWLKAVISKKILPSDNEADWLRAEQRKDMIARYSERQAESAEENFLLYQYYSDGNLEPLYEYIERSLLPHMVFYGCRTLGLSKKNAIIYSREAVSLLLTKIAYNRPVYSITALCKRTMRMKRNGNTHYYDHIPKDMRLVVDSIDYAPLEEIWKVTRDRRI